MAERMRVELTDSEWMDLIDGERPNGLAKCCANISSLRDHIISLARDGGEANAFLCAALKESLGWVLEDHEISEIPALGKLRDQLGLSISDGHLPTKRPESLI